MTDITKSDFPIDYNLVKQETLTCWKRAQGKFNIHFFSSIHSTQENLAESYARIRDYIAIYFQGNALSLDIERWNIYQFHLLTCKIDEDLKQVIEQDKFATRKIVIDALSGHIGERTIQQLIEKEVFQFSVQRRPIQRISIMDVIGQQDQDLATYLQNEMPARDHMISSLLNTFGNGQD